MSGKIDKIKNEIIELFSFSAKLLEALSNEITPGAITPENSVLDDSENFKFSVNYHIWYNQSVNIIKMVIPNRLIEFEKYYCDEKRSDDFVLSTFNIRDYLITPPGDTKITAKHRMKLISLYKIQTEILHSTYKLVDSYLTNLRTIAQADLFDSEEL